MGRETHNSRARKVEQQANLVRMKRGGWGGVGFGFFVVLGLGVIGRIDLSFRNEEAHKEGRNIRSHR